MPKNETGRRGDISCGEYGMHGISVNIAIRTPLGGWKSYEMVLRYAHLAPDHLSHAAARIERVLEIVEPNSTKTLRFSKETTHANV
jgi:hypothetical protein